MVNSSGGNNNGDSRLRGGVNAVSAGGGVNAVTAAIAQMAKASSDGSAGGSGSCWCGGGRWRPCVCGRGGRHGGGGWRWCW